jgi:hypothetical protein
MTSNAEYASLTKHLWSGCAECAVGSQSLGQAVGGWPVLQVIAQRRAVPFCAWSF